MMASGHQLLQSKDDRRLSLSLCVPPVKPTRRIFVISVFMSDVEYSRRTQRLQECVWTA